MKNCTLISYHIISHKDNGIEAEMGQLEIDINILNKRKHQLLDDEKCLMRELQNLDMQCSTKEDIIMVWQLTILIYMAWILNNLNNNVLNFNQVDLDTRNYSPCNSKLPQNILTFSPSSVVEISI
jgi:hypothetical protein